MICKLLMDCVICYKLQAYRFYTIFSTLLCEMNQLKAQGQQTKRAAPKTQVGPKNGTQLMTP